MVILGVVIALVGAALVLPNRSASSPRRQNVKIGYTWVRTPGRAGGNGEDETFKAAVQRVLIGLGLIVIGIAMTVLFGG